MGLPILGISYKWNQILYRGWTPVLIKLYLLHQWHLSYLYLSEVSWNYAFLKFCLVSVISLIVLTLVISWPNCFKWWKYNVSYILAVHSLPFFFHAFLPLCFLYPMSKYWVSPLCRFTPGAGYATMNMQEGLSSPGRVLGWRSCPFCWWLAEARSRGCCWDAISQLFSGSPE